MLPRLIAGSSLLAWIVLVFFRGGFWRFRERFGVQDAPSEELEWPSLAVIVPAHNEAELLPRTLPALLAQDYPGDLQAVVVDDRSGDGTAAVAERAGMGHARLRVVAGGPLPDGWAGKVWAMHQGVRQLKGSPDWLLLTDADILHPPGSLEALVAAATRRQVDLFSLMVRLRCQSAAERLLVPAFVYFFAKLYPFTWSNDPGKATAAAAGGCLLVRREVFVRSGGFEAMQGATIDDCALARQVKRAGGRLWLGLGDDVVSLRAYESTAEVGKMVSRNAYTQLRHSQLLVGATVAGMTLLFGVPVLSALAGLLRRDGKVAVAGLGGSALMAASYLPIVRWYGLSAWRALTLPVAALLYTRFTVDSALRHDGKR